MRRSMVELPGGSYATESEALCALAGEAARRGTSYGKLVANTTEQARREIIWAYRAERWVRRENGR